MGDFQDYFYFDLAEVKIVHFYIYFIFAAVLAGFLTFRSSSKYKIESLFIVFYILTGNLNDLLIFEIPGISFFDLQPLRFVYLLLGFLWMRKTFLNKAPESSNFPNTVPWYQIALIGYLVFSTLSIFANIFPEGMGDIIDNIAFLVIIAGMSKIADRATYELVGKAILICAAITSIVSIVQLAIDPYFLRIGTAREAFAGLPRSNGIFSQEYHHSYFLVIAIAWALFMIKKEYLKIALVVLFSIGVFCSFMRMSWVVLALVLVVYLVYIRRTKLTKLIFMGLSVIAMVLSVVILYSNDIMNSKLVKDRLSNNIDGRKGYYTMVLNNYQKRPFLGYGDKNNEVYYQAMLKITGNRDRAEGTVGGIHNGFLATLFYYGIPALVCYCFFILLSIFYHGQLIRLDNFFIIPFLCSIVYLVGNFTNTLDLLSDLGSIYAFHIGMGLGYKTLARQSLNIKEETITVNDVA